MRKVTIGSLPTIARKDLKEYSSVAVLTDPHTRQLCYPLISKRLPAHHLLEVPAGEAFKTLDTCRMIWQQMTDLRMDRHSLLVVLGGGVLGDMGGFCAATYKRGIDFLLMPTTLLAQVDASVGGKLGIDYGPLKNHIGVFRLPVQTAIGTSFLRTLPERELRSGFAEVIKHCLLSDAVIWKRVALRSLQQQPWLPLIRHSVAFKQRVTDKDPTEKGLRKILNFGHTVGHAVESHFLTGNNPLYHGEAVAAGMVVESSIAVQKGLLRPAALTEIQNYIFSVFGQPVLPEWKDLEPLMMQDKKNKGQKILMALPKGIGKAVWDVPISPAEIQRGLDAYRGH